MDKSLQDAMEEFLGTTSYDKIPGKWQDVPAEDDNDEESVKSLDILKEWNEADHPRNPAGT